MEPQERSSRTPRSQGAGPARRSHGRWLWLVAAVAVALVALVALGRPSSRTSDERGGTAATSSPSTTTSPGARDGAHYGGGDYWGTVGFHLGRIGQLSQPMNASCAGSFPPPDACAADIAEYRGQLVAAQQDLGRVHAPAFVAQADATLRRALDEDLAATAQAERALGDGNAGMWYEALAQHARAGAELNVAYAQAGRAISGR